jgi:signal transduction histidine kinase
VSNLDHFSLGLSDSVAPGIRHAGDFNALLLAIAAHDLRQPLQSILSCYSWLADRRDDDRDRLYIERGTQAVAQLTRQLDHLVEALRVHEQSGRIALTPVRVHSVFAALRNSDAEAIAHQGIELRIRPTAVTVMSDPVLLESVLRNLLRNAVKYTRPGGKVLLGCRQQGNDIRIEVHDTGVGIAPDQLARVFDAFHRVDPTRSDGLGLGLFVARRAVGFLGHRLDVRSKAGRGSSFYVVAPAAIATPRDKWRMPQTEATPHY